MPKNGQKTPKNIKKRPKNAKITKIRFPISKNAFVVTDHSPKILSRIFRTSGFKQIKY
mgnify:CR=1 FL=1